YRESRASLPSSQLDRLSLVEAKQISPLATVSPKMRYTEFFAPLALLVSTAMALPQGPSGPPGDDPGGPPSGGPGGYPPYPVPSWDGPSWPYGTGHSWRPQPTYHPEPPYHPKPTPWVPPYHPKPPLNSTVIPTTKSSVDLPGKSIVTPPASSIVSSVAYQVAPHEPKQDQDQEGEGEEQKRN
ncbi:hypothetical protein V2G26_005047, partial [Clonostachys chloroleuca]